MTKSGPERKTGCGDGVSRPHPRGPGKASWPPEGTASEEEYLYPQTGTGHCPVPMSAGWLTSQLEWQKESHMRDLGDLSRVEKRVGSEVRGVCG